MMINIDASFDVSVMVNGQWVRETEVYRAMSKQWAFHRAMELHPEATLFRVRLNEYNRNREGISKEWETFNR